MGGAVPARLTERPFTAADGRRFAFTVGAAFAVLGAILWWRGASAAPVVAWSLAAVLAAGGLLVPAHLGPVYRAWMAFGLALSKVTTPIFLGIVYFGLFLPFGAVMRLFGRHPLRQAAPSETRWVRRAEPASDLRRQF